MFPFTWYGQSYQNNDTGFLSIQLDIVGFLAVLGEGAVLANAEVASLSPFIFLPRLMPAPQCLIRPFRPKNLHEYKGFVTSIHSGNHRRHINHVGHVLVDAEKYALFSVRCVEIKRKKSKKVYTDEEHRIPEDTLTARKFGPLTWVAITGFIFSSIIFGLAIWRKDGAALVAVIILSLLSSLVGLATFWRLSLPKRAKKANAPPGDLVIRYLKGNWLIIECEEEVARELYWAPEALDYLISSSWQYRIISLVGTAMLMFGVIFLANAKAELQLAFAGAYIIMNALYWIVAALPASVNWDTSCFEINEQCIQLAPEPNSKNPEKRTPKAVHEKGTAYADSNASFTDGLWKAIVVTKSTAWIRNSEAAPSGEHWDEWLRIAEKKANEVSFEWVKHSTTGEPILMYHLPDWNASVALQECMRAAAQKHNTRRMERPPKPGVEEGFIKPGADEKV